VLENIQLLVILAPLTMKIIITRYAPNKRLLFVGKTARVY